MMPAPRTAIRSTRMMTSGVAQKWRKKGWGLLEAGV